MVVLLPNYRTPEPETPLFTIAVKREERTSVPANWQDTVMKTDGITVVSCNENLSITCTASESALKQLTEQLGQYCHIEPLVSHDLLSNTLPPAPQ